MRKDLTELVFIMDKSGSMGGLESDTVGGFNATIKRQKERTGEVLVSTVFFSNESEVVHDRVDIGRILPLKESDYRVGGCTALIDAIGGAIHHITNVHRYIREEDVPERTVFIITTDGLENVSHEYSSNEVKAMIEERKKAGWEFIFMGANIDAVETAKHFGIDEERAVNFIADGKGIQYSSRIASDAVSMLREGKIPGKEWKADAEKDFRERTKGEREK